jgi:alpha-1,3-rhamnosyl/mannosyltransferase
VLDGRVISDHFPGIGRYTYRLADALSRRDEVELTLLYHPSSRNTHYPLDRLSAASQPVDIAPVSLAEQTRLPALARQLKPDLWHAPYYIMPYWRLPCPAVVTLYDTIPPTLPQFWPRRQRLVFALAHRLALRATQHAIAISESTRRDLIRHFRADPRRVTVTQLAADDRFRPQPDAEIRRVRSQYDLPDRFILYVGINKPPKNLIRLVEAYARLLAESSPPDYDCVIAGAWDDRYPEGRQRVSELGLDDRVRFLGPIPEADLPGLYASADLFVTASLYEGFGLPALEAMACGTPVACSNTSSLPEVVGEAGLLFDPLDVDAIASAIQRAMSDPGLRRDLSDRGLERASMFTWDRVARQTLELYRAIAGKGDTDERG